MRQKAIFPIVVPPVQPAGVLSDNPFDLNMRFKRATEPIRAGARVRVWGGYEDQPLWLPEPGGRIGVLGVVTRFLGVGNSSKEIVMKLDHPLCVGDYVGEFLVLCLAESSVWKSGERVGVELCSFEPSFRFLRHRDHGIHIETSAICELL